MALSPKNAITKGPGLIDGLKSSLLVNNRLKGVALMIILCLAAILLVFLGSFSLFSGTALFHSNPNLKGSPQANNSNFNKSQGNYGGKINNPQEKVLSRTYLSPIPGRVVEINVVPGQSVAIGQKIFVIDLMKMDVTINSTVSGKVKQINVKPNDIVEVTQPILLFE
jgi:biotin carboxyl carrier protein